MLVSSKVCRSSECQRGKPSRARLASSLTFSSDPGIAAVDSYISSCIGSGSKSHSPWRIAFNTDYRMFAPWKWTAIHTMVKRKSKVNDFENKSGKNLRKAPSATRWSDQIWGKRFPQAYRPHTPTLNASCISQGWFRPMFAIFQAH